MTANANTTNTPLVTVIITNYNYGRFLPSAIESVLNQTYRNIQILVVDDGSTDGSQTIITGYGEQITAVFKDNGGQISGFNVGFASSRGRFVIFLDADDMLLPATVQLAVDTFLLNPRVVRVTYRLGVIDGAARATGEVRPPHYLHMPDGNVCAEAMRFPDDLSWPPTSGNAFAARVLSKIFPIPDGDNDRVDADSYLHNIVPLYGEVRALQDVGGLYRVHGANNHDRFSIDLHQSRKIIRQSYRNHVYIKQHSVALGLAGAVAAPADVLSVTFFAHRMVSLKLDPSNHPLPDDSLLRLCAQGMRASRHRYDVSFSMKATYVAWFALMTVAPAPVAMKLAEQFFLPETRGWTKPIVAALRRGKRMRL